MTETTTHTLGNGATKRLERSRSDRKLAGVSGGLARYFDIHPAVYRVGFVVLTLLGGAGILIYLAAALAMPDEGQEDSFATAALRNRRDRPWPLIGLGLVGVAFVTLLSRATLWPQGDAWIVLLVAGAAILWITRHGKAATADAATARSRGLASPPAPRQAHDDRVRHAPRAAARRRRGRRGDVQRPSRRRHRRTQLRRRRHAGSPRARTSSESAS